MKKTIFEEMGGTYVRCGDYFITNLTLPEEEEPRFIGVWGHMGTKTFAVFEGIPQNCISGSADEWQTEPLSGRYRGTGSGTL